MSKTLVRSCSCKSQYQDSKYGKDQRVHNEGIKSWNCTVCGTKKNKQ